MKDLFTNHDVLICCGSGGVGKTSISAALGVMAANMGKKTLISTIDPAKRLADSLGINLDNTERRVENGLISKGELWAMMLDCKTTFDWLIDKYAPSKEIKDKILANTFYQAMSTHATGSHEYMAMEKLYDLSRRKDYDLIILDTPPTKHALDFLDAPRRLLEFFDERRIGWFLKPTIKVGRLSLSIFKNATLFSAKIIDKVIGLDLLEQVKDFFQAFESMYKGFQERASKVEEILRQEKTTFVIVASPAYFPLKEARYLKEKLIEKKLSIGAVIVNRVHTLPAGLVGIDNLEEKLGEALARMPKIADKVIMVYQKRHILSSMDDREIGSFKESLNGIPLYQIPLFDQDISDLEGLISLGEYLKS